MNKVKELTSEEVKLEAVDIKKVKVTEKIRGHVANLLMYMNDERKDYERCLEDEPESAKTHVWVYITAIANWIGLTENEAYEQYGPVYDEKGYFLGMADELNKVE